MCEHFRQVIPPNQLCHLYVQRKLSHNVTETLKKYKDDLLMSSEQSSCFSQLVNHFRCELNIGYLIHGPLMLACTNEQGKTMSIEEHTTTEAGTDRSINQSVDPMNPWFRIRCLENDLTRHDQHCQSINQSINQSIDQSINRSID